MTSPTSRDGKENELLKVDTKGRVQIPPDRRKDLLEELDRSGMTGAAFAKHCGINHDKALLFGNKAQQSVNLSGEVKPLGMGVASELDRDVDFSRIGFGACLHRFSGWGFTPA